MRLAVITDEIDRDLEHAARVADRLGIRALELRTVGGANVADLTPAARARVRELLAGGGLECCGIASDYLKCDPDHDEGDVLERALEAARELGAPHVRCFSWWRLPHPGTAQPYLLSVLQRAAERAREAGIRLLLQNQPECNVGTGPEAAWYLERLPSAHFGLAWDPGSQARLGLAPFPAGYAAVRGRVGHVRVTDLAADGGWTLPGDGVCDWPGQLAALAEDRFAGALAVETHHQAETGGGEAATMRAVARLQQLCAGAGISLR
jgi:L-ribulose-5-phosphate 3-epimerase